MIPIVNNALLKLRGRWRLLFGVCPACNSDAPEMCDCKICDWALRNTLYEGMHGITEKEDRKYWWNRFAYYIDNKLPTKKVNIESSVKKYVLGFAFNDYHVLLINKKRPKWQKGLYNGLGGHIEEAELPIDSMVREFSEECGVVTTPADWDHFAIMKGEDWICYCFRSRNVFDLAKAKQTTDEEIKIINAYTLENYPTISNIPALIGLAMDNHIPILTTFDYGVKVTVPK